MCIRDSKESLQREDYRPELPISEQRAHDFHRDALGLHWVDDIAVQGDVKIEGAQGEVCLLYTSPSPRDRTRSRMPSSA